MIDLWSLFYFLCKRFHVFAAEMFIKNNNFTSSFSVDQRQRSSITDSLGLWGFFWVELKHVSEKRKDTKLPERDTQGVREKGVLSDLYSVFCFVQKIGVFSAEMFSKRKHAF